VCQLCFGKAKISCDFIARIVELEKSLNHKMKPKKIMTNTTHETADDILKKMQRNSGISIRKVTKKDVEEIIICSSPEPDDDLLQEVGFAKREQQDDARSFISSEDQFEVIDDDSDEDFKPNKPQTSKKKSPNVSRSSNKSTSKSQGVYIDTAINFTCAKCKKSFGSFDVLSEHMKERTCFSEVIQCQICAKHFQTKKNLYAHMQTHKPKQKLMCDECAKEFNNQFDLDQHKESIHNRVMKRGEFTYRCSHCQEAFSSHFELLEHVKEHQKEKKDAPRLCEICARLCANLKAYQAHMANHQPQKRSHVCDVSQS
jgi:hypothetical protein